MSHGRPLPPPPSGSGRPQIGAVVGLVGGLTAVAVGVAVAAVLAATASPSGSATPEEALQGYFDADAAGNCAVLVEHPISGYDDVADCEDRVAERRAEDEEAGIDPDSRFREFEVMETHEVSEDVVDLFVDYGYGYVEDGEDQYSGNYSEFRVVRGDDGWVVSELTYED